MDVKALRQIACCPQLMPETLFLTTNLIDRFLEIKGVTRKNLQLVSVFLISLSGSSSLASAVCNDESICNRTGVVTQSVQQLEMHLAACCKSFPTRNSAPKPGPLEALVTHD